jgi:hypothetical protein
VPDIFDMLAGAAGIDPSELRKAHASRLGGLRRLEGAELDKAIKELDDAGGISLDGGKSWINSRTPDGGPASEAEAEFDPKIVHVVRLVEGDGDTMTTLVNSKTFGWIINGGTIPPCNVKARITEAKRRGWTEDQVNEDLAELNGRLDKLNDNDRALNAAPDEFGGEYFSHYSTVSEVMAFVQKHGLTLSPDEYEGVSY